MSIEEGDLLKPEDNPDGWIVVINTDDNYEAVEKRGDYIEYFTADREDNLVDLNKHEKIGTVDDKLLWALRQHTNKVGLPKIAKVAECDPNKLRNLKMEMMD